MMEMVIWFIDGKSGSDGPDATVKSSRLAKEMYSGSDGPDATVKSSRLAKEMYSGIEGQNVVSSSAIEDPLVKKGQETRELISNGVGGRLGGVEIELRRSTEEGD
jgi:hypothetical protein